MAGRSPARAMLRAVGERHRNRQPRSRIAWEDGEQWFGFDSVRILPGSDAEILLIPLPGHTLGHTGVAVKQANRWLLHCGDAYFHHGEVQTPAPCPSGLRAFQALNQVDGAARRQNRERLRELAQRHAHDVELICSHDASTLARYHDTA